MLLLPLGALHKTEVRKIAQEHSFINAQKHDSQDICFVPDGDYARFMEQFTGKHYPAGDFLDRSGKVVGTHSGAVRYTLGQRKGLALRWVRRCTSAARICRPIPSPSGRRVSCSTASSTQRM